MNAIDEKNRARAVHHLVASRATSDGAGVSLRRSLGGRPEDRMDPLLMLDEFYSDDPREYLAGFPPHPHRGFETVTYMLEGRMRHEDHLGNRGDLGPGDLQWMTAGRGIVHSEMPQQRDGCMRGFQLWINLPAAEKMQPPAYRDVPATAIPERETAAGGRIRILAGRLHDGTAETVGPINDRAGTMRTDPIYLDVALAGAERLSLPLPASHGVFVYVYEGAVRVGEDATEVPPQTGAILGPGERVVLEAAPDGGRALVIAARPLDEPVVQYGPFVMNTREEVEQALADYRDGRLTEPA